MSFNIGYTSVLAADTGMSSAFVEIANLTEIKLPAIDIKDVAATTLNQANNIEQSIPGMRSNSKLTAMALYTNASYTALRALVGVSHNFKVTLSDTHTYTWGGYLCKVGEVEISNDKTISFGIEITVLTDVTAG